MKTFWFPLRKTLRGTYPLPHLAKQQSCHRVINENTSLKQRNMHLEDLKEKRFDDSSSLCGRSTMHGTGGAGDPGISWSASEGMIGGTACFCPS